MKRPHCILSSLALTAVVASSAPGFAQVPAGELLASIPTPAPRLAHLATDGTVVDVFGSPKIWLGAGILSNGNWVTTYLGSGFLVWDPVLKSVVLDQPTPENALPGDVAVFADDTIAIADWDNNVVYRYDASGTLRDTYTFPGASSIYGIHVDQNDELWVTDHDQPGVFHIDKAGNVLPGLATPTGTGDLVMAVDGTLWVARGAPGGEVYHYAGDGTLLGSFQTQGEDSIAITPDQTLWLGTDPFSEGLLHYSRNGDFLGQIDTNGYVAFLTAPRGAEVGASYCGPALANSSGGSAFLAPYGSAAVADGQLTLRALQLPTNETAYWLNSPQQGFSANPGGSQGNLCLGGAIGRHLDQVGSTGLAGSFLIDLDLQALPRTNGTTAIQPGETWHFQCWFRDGASSNFTDGSTIQFL